MLHLRDGLERVGVSLAPIHVVDDAVEGTNRCCVVVCSVSCVEESR